MKLFYAEVLNPRKVCALAKHLNAPVEFVRVDLRKGEQMSPAFRARNPNAKVPVLQDGDTVLWETDAIMCHLAWHAGSDMWPRDARQIDVIRWLSWNQAHFNRFAGQLYFEYVIKAKYGVGEPNPAKVDEATKFFRIFGAVLNDHLKGRAYLLGDDLTIADFSVAATLPYAREARLPLAEFPAIERWHSRLDALPAWHDPFPPVVAAA